MAGRHERGRAGTIDILVVSALALNGCLMAPLPSAIPGGFFAAAIALAVVLDGLEVVPFRLLRITWAG